MRRRGGPRPPRSPWIRCSNRAPFPIRIQSPADLEAARFELLAWQNPYDAGGFPSPFWVQDGMVEAVLEPEAQPLAEVVAAAGGAVEGLRLAGGGLVLKIACAGAVVQVRLRGPAPFPEDGGIEIRHRFGLKISEVGTANARLLERCGPAGPSDGAGLGGAEDLTLVKVLEGLRAERTQREIAEDIFGADEVAADWYSDGGMRSQVRRWIRKARALVGGGWRDLVPRYVPDGN